MVRFADMYAAARSAVLVWSMGVTQHASGLDNVPREMYGDIEVPKKLLGRPFVRSALGGRRFTDVTLEVTAGQLQVKELGWTFKRQPAPRH